MRGKPTAARLFWLSCAYLIPMVLSSSPADASASPTTVLGIWASAPSKTGRAHIEVKEIDGELVGDVVWLEKPIFEAADGVDLAGQPKTDQNNPKASLRDVPIVGLRILRGMKPTGATTWEGGTIYDPENGKTYKSKMTFSNPNRIKMRGFIGISLLGRTTEWTRVERERE
ncbi:MAG: DUF2147 domain-containing protein [Deltaproteobacteria bacterium]|nr:DUF2147 domain-containing protein [Deltaproteobacteria bacterium]